MTLEFLIKGMGSVVVLAAAFHCAIYWYRFTLRKPKPSFPIATVVIIGVTSLTTGLQFVFPEILSEFRRNPEALRAGEWWRVITPLFVQADGWKQCLVNGVGALVFCPLAEKLYGKRLFALYFIPGVLGQIFAYVWSPNGAGSSLGIAGAIGSLFAFTFLHRQRIPTLVNVFAILGFGAAVVLSFCRDNHGPPILIGVLLAGLMKMLRPDKTPEREPANAAAERSLDYTRMTLSRKLRLACLMFLLVCAVGCDQATKHIARMELNQTSSFGLSGGLVEFRLAENPGSFLSFGAQLPNSARFTAFTLGVGIGLVALAAYLVSRAPLDLWRFIGLSLVLAGGVSNLLDRLLRQGLVTDFITIRVGPFHTGVFNAADVLIMMGVGVIVYTFRKRTSTNSPTNQMPRNAQ